MSFMHPAHASERTPLLRHSPKPVKSPRLQYRDWVHRSLSAPSSTGAPSHDIFTSFPSFHHRRETIGQRIAQDLREHVTATEDAAELGCLHLSLRAARWWLWRKWRS